MVSVVTDARRFADMCALYRFYDESGRLLYVGMTGNLPQRIADHEVKRWYTLVAEIKIEWFPHKAAARLAERRAISGERPRYNIADRKPPSEPKKPRPVRRKPKATPTCEKPKATPTCKPRDLIADITAILGDGIERVRLSTLPHLLRQHAPDWEPYQNLNGVQLRKQLMAKGVRTIKAGNVPRLDPADLRKVLESGFWAPN